MSKLWEEVVYNYWCPTCNVHFKADKPFVDKECPYCLRNLRRAVNPRVVYLDDVEGKIEKRIVDWEEANKGIKWYQVIKDVSGLKETM